MYCHVSGFPKQKIIQTDDRWGLSWNTLARWLWHGTYGIGGHLHVLRAEIEHSVTGEG